MSADDELQAIREKKLEELRAKATGEAPAAEDASPDQPVHVDSPDHFRDIVADGVVLVDFYADWCGPCKAMEPALEELAANVDGTVAKVDVDVHRELASQHQVQGIPTLVFYADGEPAERLVGGQSKQALAQTFERLLA
jgi:thioredoxin 1